MTNLQTTTHDLSSPPADCSTLAAARLGLTVEEVFESISSAFADQDLPPVCVVCARWCV